MTLHCPECAKELKNSFLYCPHCGSEVRGVDKCSSCGDYLNNSWKFCPYCSYQTKADIPEKPPIDDPNIADPPVDPGPYPEKPTNANRKISISEPAHSYYEDINDIAKRLRKLVTDVLQTIPEEISNTIIEEYGLLSPGYKLHWARANGSGSYRFLSGRQIRIPRELLPGSYDRQEMLEEGLADILNPAVLDQYLKDLDDSEGEHQHLNPVYQSVPEMKELDELRQDISSNRHFRRNIWFLVDMIKKPDKETATLRRLNRLSEVGWTHGKIKNVYRKVNPAATKLLNNLSANPNGLPLNMLMNLYVPVPKNYASSQTAFRMGAKTSIALHMKGDELWGLPSPLRNHPTHIEDDPAWRLRLVPVWCNAIKTFNRQ